MEAFAHLFKKQTAPINTNSKLDTKRAKTLFFYVPDHIKQQLDGNEETFHFSYGILFLKTLCLLTEAVCFIIAQCFF